MTGQVRDKLIALQEVLQRYDRVAVAYSGGVDSTLLLRVACDTLGAGHVTAIHAVTCLTPVSEQEQAARLIADQNIFRCAYIAVALYPLQWPEFASNTELRCYYCKKNIYTAFLAHLPSPIVLLDGTNKDDLQQHRPGLQAIRELSLPIPLAESGLTKNEIRKLARQMGLPNWDRPSDSCLATRIPTHQPITLPLLQQIAQVEDFLKTNNFHGSRVRLDGQTISIHIPATDLQRCRQEPFHRHLSVFLAGQGLTNIPVKICCR